MLWLHEFDWSPAATDLAANVPVGKPDDHAVLGRVVLVLVLHHQALASEKVGFPLWQNKENELLMEINRILTLWSTLSVDPTEMICSYLSSSWTSLHTSWSRPCSSPLWRNPEERRQGVSMLANKDIKSGKPHRQHNMATSVVDFCVDVVPQRGFSQSIKAPCLRVSVGIQHGRSSAEVSSAMKRHAGAQHFTGPEPTNKPQTSTNIWAWNRWRHFTPAPHTSTHPDRPLGLYI